MKNLYIYYYDDTETMSSLVKAKCDYQVTEYKYGRKIVKTLTGQTKEKFIGVYRKFSITYPYLTVQEYEDLLLIWRVNYDTYIQEANGQELNVMIIDNEINFPCLYNKEKDEYYYTGTLNVDETFGEVV